MANGGGGFPYGGVGMAFDALLDGIQNIAFAIGEGTRDVFNKLTRAPLESFLDLPYNPRQPGVGGIPQSFAGAMQQAANAIGRFISGVDTSVSSMRSFNNFVQQLTTQPSAAMRERQVGLPEWLVRRGIEEGALQRQTWKWFQAQQLQGLTSQLIQHLGLSVPSTTPPPQPFPYYEYAFSPFKGLLEWRMGFRQGLRGEATTWAPQQMLYYGAPYFTGLAFKAAKEAEGKGGELDLANLRRIMYESQRTLSEQARIFSTLFRTMFAGARNIRTLREMGAPSYLVEEVSRSYEIQTVPQLQQISSQISSVLSQYMQSFYHLAGTGGGAQLRAMNVFEGKASVGYTYPIYTMEQIGEVIRGAQGSLAQLNQMLVFPGLRREAAVSLQSGALTFANQFLTSLYSEGVQLPPQLQARLENVMTTHQQYNALREEMNRYLEAFNKYYPTASQRTEAIPQLRAREKELEVKRRELKKKGLDLPEEEAEELKIVRSKRQELEAQEKQYQIAREKLPDLSERVRNVYRNLSEGIGGFIDDLEKAVREGRLDKSVADRTKAVLGQLRNLERTARIITGEEQLTPYERYLQPTFRGIQAASEMFGVMNVRNFQIALMFGMSSMLFNALTQIPMEATYKTIQPLFGAIGGITGITPFYQEIAGFGYQAPRVMADIEARMASMQSLLGSRYFAESAITKAIEISRVQPIQFPEAMEILTAMSVYPSTRSYAMRESFQTQIFNATQLLSMLAPEQGIGGALFAIRELLGGQFRSLQLRFNISPEILAAYAGKTVAEFKSAPGLEKIEILAKALEAMFGGEEVLFRRGAQFEVQLRNISDTLISSIALPMVREIQPMFTSLIRDMMNIRRPGRPPAFEQITRSPFFQLLPEAQQRGLRRVAEERAYMMLGIERQEVLGRWIEERLGRKATPVEQIEALLGAKTSELPQELRQLREELRSTLIPRQMEAVATQTYGTATGMMSLLTTSFNRLLDPLVRALNIQGGVSNVIFGFAQRTLQEATVFQRRLGGAGTDEERRRLAEEFVRGFVSNLRDAIQMVSNAFNASDIKGIISPITELMREATMAAFKPLAETIMVQTVKTAINIPGTLVGGSIVGALTDLRTGGLRTTLASMVGTAGGIASWISMSTLGREGWDIWRVSRGFLGGALLQYGLTQASPGWGMIMAPLGAYLLSHTFMFPQRPLLGGLRQAISGRFAAFFNSLASFFQRPGFMRGLGAAGIAYGLWREYTERRDYGAPPWYITATRFAGPGLMMAAPLLGPYAIPAALMGAAISGIGELIDARRLGGMSRIARQYVLPSPTEVARSISENIELAQQERRAYMNRLLTSMGTTYGLGGDWWKEYRRQVIQAEVEPYRAAGEVGRGFGELIKLMPQLPQYLGKVALPEEVGKMKTEELMSYIYKQSPGLAPLVGKVQEAFEKAGVKDEMGKGIAALFTLMAGYRLAAVPKEKREEVIERMGKGIESFTAGMADLFGRYARGEMTKEEFGVKVNELMRNTLSAMMPQGPRGRELTERVLQMMAQALREIAGNTKETVQKMDAMSQQTFRERVYPRLAREALVDVLYRRGYEAPKTIPEEYFSPQNTQQLRTRIQEIAANLQGMTKATHDVAFQRGTLMMLAGAVRGRELRGVQAMYGRYLFQGLQAGMIGLETVAPNSQQLLENIMAMRMAGYSMDQIREVLRKQYEATATQRIGDMSKQIEQVAKYRLKLSTPEGMLEAFGEAADAITEGGDKVKEALEALAEMIRNALGIREEKKESKKEEPTLMPDRYVEMLERKEKEKELPTKEPPKLLEEKKPIEKKEEKMSVYDYMPESIGFDKKEPKGKEPYIPPGGEEVGGLGMADITAGIYEEEKKKLTPADILPPATEGGATGGAGRSAAEGGPPTELVERVREADDGVEEKKQVIIQNATVQQMGVM